MNPETCSGLQLYSTRIKFDYPSDLLSAFFRVLTQMRSDEIGEGTIDEDTLEDLFFSISNQGAIENRVAFSGALENSSVNA